MSASRDSTQALPPLPKLCGADIELGNFITGMQRSDGTGYEASQALLAEIRGLPRAAAGSGGGYAGGGYGSWGGNPQDVGRRFLAEQGGAAYIDLNHLELCLPCVLSAFDHAAAWHAMLRVARQAQQAANAALPKGQRVQVLVNSTDGQNHSYGAHLNFLLRRRTYENIFARKPHYLQFLASFQVSAMLLTGQGKVGSENRQPEARYQLWQRADFFERLQSLTTTHARGIVNSRDESLCGARAVEDPAAPARLHVIAFDSTLAHGASILRAGMMQLILTLLERGTINSRLILDDPLEAAVVYSHDPALRARSALTNGRRYNLVELQCGYLEEVKRQAARGAFAEAVPRAGEVIALWEETLARLCRDRLSAAPRVDWLMKLVAIEQALDENPGLDWESPEIKLLDHLYSSLSAEDGLYWNFEAAGLAERLLPEERIAYFGANPPEDTRAWCRAMLLRRAGAAGVVTVDWDQMTFKLPGRFSWPTYRTVALADPLGYTRAELEPLFAQCATLTDLLDALDDYSAARERSPYHAPWANSPETGEEDHEVPQPTIQ
jgi:proteasome accessory factor A